LWQEQRHRMMVDSERCRAPGIAALTWPHTWCASSAQARDLPGAATPGPALDTAKSLHPPVADLRASHGPLLGVYGFRHDRAA
jgi:hypothetical protein